MHELSLPKRWLTRPPRASAPPHLLGWLTDPHSLTARIRARCGTFRVEVLRQALDHPHPDEAILFGLRPRDLVWVREVLLLADERPVVFARSILPRGHVSGTWNLFHRIGNRPLGAALFANPAVVRAPLTCACLDRRDARYHHALKAHQPQTVPPVLWARRSVFRLRSRVLLVSEVFLPAIADLPK